MSFFGTISDSLSDAASWTYEQLKAGPPGSPGRSTEGERAAYERGVTQTAHDVTNYVEKVATDAYEEAAPVAREWGSAFVEQLKAGPPGGMGRSTPEERTAYEEGVSQLPAAVKETVKRAGGVLEFVTRPWVLLVIGGVVVLAVAAPYVTPFIRRS